MNSARCTILVRFPEDSPEDANLAVQRLGEFIQAEAAGQEAAREESAPVLTPCKDRQDTQDLGSILALTFGTPFAVAIARGLAAYIQAVGSRVVIETPEGKVIASGDGAKNIDVAKTVAALGGAQARSEPAAKRVQPRAPDGAASSAKPAPAKSARPRGKAAKK